MRLPQLEQECAVQQGGVHVHSKLRRGQPIKQLQDLRRPWGLKALKNNLNICSLYVTRLEVNVM